MKRPSNSLGNVPAEMAAAISTLRSLQCQNAEDAEALDYAVTTIETFVAVAIRVMRKSKPSKVRSAAMDVEIKSRLDGVEMVDGAA